MRTAAHIAHRTLKRLRRALKLPVIVDRQSDFVLYSLMAVTASPSAMPGARLNEIVTAGSWPKMIDDSGMVPRRSLVTDGERHQRCSVLARMT